MPPSLGNRDDNSITANPCGIKKKTAAINHINNDPGPNFAVVPRCLRPRTATRLNRTRSRSLSARTRCGCLFCVVSVGMNAALPKVICYRLFDAKWEGRRARLAEVTSDEPEGGRRNAKSEVRGQRSEGGDRREEAKERRGKSQEPEVS